MTSFLQMCRKTRIYRHGKPKQAINRSVTGRVQLHSLRQSNLYQITVVSVKKILGSVGDQIQKYNSDLRLESCIACR
jgi:hypothetical protein